MPKTDKQLIQQQIQQRAAEIQALQDQLESDGDEMFGDIPSHVTVALTTLRAIHRSLRHEHKIDIETETTGSGEYGSETKASEKNVSICRKLSKQEEALRDKCCESIGVYLDIYTSLLESSQSQDDAEGHPHAEA